MLDVAGGEYAGVSPHIDEDELKLGLSDAGEIALRVASAKAVSVPGQWVIGSDSVVSVEGRSFDKPRNQDNAAEHLRHFSGKTLLLTSSVALASG